MSKLRNFPPNYKPLKEFYTTDFVEATKAHLVPAAMEEIYLFRTYMQVEFPIYL